MGGGRRSFGMAMTEVEADEKSGAADLKFQRRGRGQLPQFGAQARTEFSRLGGKISFFDFGDLGQSHGATDWMAEKSAGMDGFARRGGPGSIEEVGWTDARGERKAARQRFSQADEIGNGVGMFGGEPFSSASEPGVNFVQDQKSGGAITEPAQFGEEFGWGDADAATGLDRFDEHGADATACESGLDFGKHLMELGSGSWERKEEGELRQLWEKRATEKGPVGGVECAVAKPVVALFKSDDAGLSGGEEGGFEGGFDGFEAGIAEDGFCMRRASNRGVRARAG